MTLLKRFAQPTLMFTFLALVLGPPNLHATAIVTTYQFTGTCLDCTGIGTGMLTVENYTPGTSLSTANFVSFSYDSNLFSYSIPSVDQLGFITGQLPDAMPGQAFIDIADTSIPAIVFVSFMNGSWCVGTNCGADNGTVSSWDTAQGAPAPEPTSLLLVVPTVLGFVMLRRRLTKRV